VAEKEGLWSSTSGERLDFKSVYGFPQPIEREPYVSRRQWRFLSQFAPSLNLQPILTSFELPFSVRPDEKISLEQVVKLHRDHFEGTPFDTTVGIEAGPWGNPNRYDQYEGVEEGEKISTILQSLYGSGLGQYGPSSLPNVRGLQEELWLSPTIDPRLYQLLSNDGEKFANFEFAKKLNFNTKNYTKTFPDDILSQFSTIIENINNTASLGSAQQVDDVYNLDRTRGEPLSDNILGKGFFERTISLFRTSYSHITTLTPSYSSVYYPGCEYLSEDPTYVPYFQTKQKRTTSSSQNQENLSKSEQNAQVDLKTSLSSKSVQKMLKFKEILKKGRFFSQTTIPRSLAFVTYISLHQPAQSSYTPVFPALPTQLNREFTQGSLWKYSEDSAWWKFAQVCLTVFFWFFFPTLIEPSSILLKFDITVFIYITSLHFYFHIFKSHFNFQSQTSFSNFTFL
jgi:hypothetical protein